MQKEPPSPAWLEQPGRDRVLIEGNLTIGRAPNNLLVLNEEKVSRRHATINPQSNGECLFIDLGSSNGSYVNGRRVSHPRALRDGDRVQMGSQSFVFRHPGQRSHAGMRTVESEKTIQDIRPAQCWLMVADMEGSTQFVQRLSQEEATNRTAQWLAECRALVESHHGIINKFLGDGFFAYWKDDEGVAADVADALRLLAEQQRKESPRFRLVLHYGQVFVGGAASLGEESLLGNEVNFVFRMEKVASALGCACLISRGAREKLLDHLPMAEVCHSAVSGFSGEFDFYAPDLSATI